MGETQILADYIARASYDDLPSSVVLHAKKCISDTIACGLGGRKTHEGDVLIDLMQEFGEAKQATVMGDRAKLSFVQAAAVNRVLTNMLDYDDTLIKVGHLSSVLVPVALAVGERVNAPGKDIINALVLGYETVSRIRDAVFPSEEVFWTTFEKIDSGVHFGATVVAGKLMGLSSAQMAAALGLSGFVRTWRVTFPDLPRLGMPPWMKVTGGDIVIPGIHSVLLAARGFPGDAGILDQGSGYNISVGSDRYDASKLVAGLGEDYGTLGIGFKFYSACRLTSAALDAVASIRNEQKLTADDVEHVSVELAKLLAEIAVYEPSYMIQAQFSIPYVVSMILSGEPCGPSWYTEEMLKSPRLRDLQHRVTVKEDPAATKAWTAEYKLPATVELTTRDGGKFRKYVEYPKGEPENPFTEEDHYNKLKNMATCAGMKEHRIEQLNDTLNSIEMLSSISELTCLLVP
ncbi:MAG: MmgE/PrpD family protein [Deltaproteobacteria bacterium]|nr:MmgE/PrpD family protein [Deltaproteobacteria bacterium]